MQDWRAQLDDALGAKVDFNVPLANKVAFKIGGPADAFAKPVTSDDLAHILRIADDARQPITILGTGSNVLVSDKGIRGITIRLSGSLTEVVLQEETSDVGVLRVGSGALNPPVVSKALKNDLIGIEFLATIPGTFGGALIMNAGAHGGEIGPFVQEVTVLVPGQGAVTRPGVECGFTYRNSSFLPTEIITEAVLRIPKGDSEKARLHLKEMRSRRKATQPIREPNAGSIFKNPEGDYAGRLIEACGLKGLRKGGACISPKHANFIVNENSATATDVSELAEVARREVREKFSVDLHWEVKRIGEW